MSDLERFNSFFEEVVKETPNVVNRICYDEISRNRALEIMQGAFARINARLQNARGARDAAAVEELAKGVSDLAMGDPSADVAMAHAAAALPSEHRAR